MNVHPGWILTDYVASGNSF